MPTKLIANKLRAYIYEELGACLADLHGEEFDSLELFYMELLDVEEKNIWENWFFNFMYKGKNYAKNRFLEKLMQME